MQVAVHGRKPHAARALLVTILMMCEVQNVRKLIDECAEGLTADWRYKGMSMDRARAKLDRYIARRLEHGGALQYPELFEGVDLDAPEEPAYRTDDEIQLADDPDDVLDEEAGQREYSFLLGA
jgi:hypothetical protein